MLRQPDYTNMTEAEYIVFEENSDIKHEYVNGKIFAMTGATIRHTLINNNTSRALANMLADTNHIVLSNNIRVKVESKVSYRYPDTMVVYDKIEHVDNRKDTICNPIVIVEVLSPQTAYIDHTQKSFEYTQIPSLQAYVVISQGVFRVEYFVRNERNKWEYFEIRGLDSVLHLPSIGCDLALADIYKKLDFIDDGIKIHTVGHITMGLKYKDWYIFIQTYSDTGSYLLLISDDKTFGKDDEGNIVDGEGYDSWFPDMLSVEHHCEKHHWQIEWLDWRPNWIENHAY